ncbi:hypothetical protein GW916_11350 [bacterium]|nr:hypothetical protein [bacterium]
MKALLLAILTTSALFIGGAHAETGMPWPWPWARECPIDFSGLEGTFRARGSDMVEFIQIDIQQPRSVKEPLTIEIRLFDKKFDVLAMGRAQAFASTRSIYIPLENYINLDMEALKLRIFRKSQRVSCDPKNLIPILMVSKGGAQDKQELGQMVLEPLGDFGNQDAP